MSISYHQYIELNNDLSNTISWKLIDSSQLSYAGEVEIGNLVRLVTDKDFASNSQCIYNEIPTLKKNLNLIVRVRAKQLIELVPVLLKMWSTLKLPYDINQTMVPET